MNLNYTLIHKQWRQHKQMYVNSRANPPCISMYCARTDWEEIACSKQKDCSLRKKKNAHCVYEKHKKDNGKDKQNEMFGWCVVSYATLIQYLSFQLHFFGLLFLFIHTNTNTRRICMKWGCVKYARSVNDDDDNNECYLMMIMWWFQWFYRWWS